MLQVELKEKLLYSESTQNIDIWIRSKQNSESHEKELVLNE